MSIRDLFDIPIPILRDAYKKVLEKHDADCLIVNGGEFFKSILGWCDTNFSNGDKIYRIDALDWAFEMIEFVEEIINGSKEERKHPSRSV